MLAIIIPLAFILSGIIYFSFKKPDKPNKKEDEDVENIVSDFKVVHGNKKIS